MSKLSDVEVDLYGGRILFRNEEVRMNSKQLLALEKLLSAYPSGVSYERMIDALWSDPAELVDADNCLHSYISRMRRSFSDKGWPIAIRSQRACGYRLEMLEAETA